MGCHFLLQCNSYDSTSKRSSIKIWAEDLKRHFFLKKTYTGTWRDAQHDSSLRNYKSKPQWDIISHLYNISHSVMSDSLSPHGLQHSRLPSWSPTPRVYSNSCPLSRWCHPAISSSVIPFTSHLYPFPVSEAFPMSHFFTSGGQSIGVPVSASVFPINIQYWFPLGWTGWISLQSKGLSRVFSNTTVQKHQLFSAQVFFIVQISHPYITTRKTIAFTRWTIVGKIMSILF